MSFHLGCPVTTENNIHGYYTIKSNSSGFLKASPSSKDLVLDQLLLLAAGVPSGPCTGHQLLRSP